MIRLIAVLVAVLVVILCVGCNVDGEGYPASEADTAMAQKVLFKYLRPGGEFLYTVARISEDKVWGGHVIIVLGCYKRGSSEMQYEILYHKEANKPLYVKIAKMVVLCDKEYENALNMRMKIGSK